MRLAMTAPAMAMAMAIGLLPAEGQAAGKHGKEKPAAAARSEIGACESAYKLAQENERGAHLLQAKELWLRCARPTCGAFFQHECTARYTQLDADIPSVIPVVLDARGVPRVDVEVRMDGEALTSHLDGHALAIDPGVHEFSFSTAAGVFASQQIMVLQGQRNRPVSASIRSAELRREKIPKAIAAAESPPPAPTPVPPALPSPEAAAREVTDRETAATEGAAPEGTLTAAAEPTNPHRKLIYALGAGGLAGVGAGALLVYWGRKDNDMLTRCAQDCNASTTAHIRRLYLAANISFGVGVAALGAAYWVYAVSQQSPKGEVASKEQAYRFDVAPVTSGAVASVSGSF
jgi:hypothetical protein